MSESNSPNSTRETRPVDLNDNLSSSMDGEESNQVSSTPRSKRLSERSKRKTVVHHHCENVIASTSSASGSRSATVLMSSTSTRRPRGRPRSGTVDSPAAVFPTNTASSNLEAVSNLPDLHELSDLMVLEVSSNKSSSNKSVDSCAIIDISKEDDDCLIIGATRRRQLSNPANGSVTIILDDDLPSSSDASRVAHNPFDVTSRKKSKATHHSEQPEDKTEAPADNPNLPHCPICLENLTEIRQHNKQLMTTLCGHIVCNVCLNEHFKTTPGAKTINCPTCRTKLTKSKIHALYL